jgi:ATP-dependent Lon protease
MRRYSLDEITFYRALSPSAKESVIINEQELANAEDAMARRPLRFKILMSGMTTRNKATALRKIGMLKGDSDSSSHHKISEWINGLLSLPIGRYIGLPVTSASTPDKIGDFLRAMRTQLDAAVFGHAAVKDHVVRLLAQWISNPSSRGLVLGIHGPPGVGKTELCRAICRCLGLPFAFVPLGGISDGSHLDGHSYTYEGAVWGKVSDVLMKCGCMNPVLFFDELDKISETRHGDEIVNLLIHITDATQNTQFADKYFVDVDIDLSRCLMVFSYNDETRVSPVLLDRMTRIRAEGYSASDKVSIAQSHLLPAILGEFGLGRDAVRVSRDTVQRILAKNEIESEAGVRGLKRAIHNIVSHLNYERMVEGVEAQFSIDITESHVDKFASPTSAAGNTALPASVRSMYV